MAMTRDLNFGSFSNVGIGSSSSLRSNNLNLMRLSNCRRSLSRRSLVAIPTNRNEPSTENKASSDVVTRCNSNPRPLKHHGNLSQHHVVDHLDLCSELHLLSSTPSHSKELPTLLYLFQIQQYNCLQHKNKLASTVFAVGHGCLKKLQLHCVLICVLQKLLTAMSKGGPIRICVE
ncbi:hypothetical protein F8388_005349 [Cannabis sativa]|uniref:Uncharacterized protein n=1 Tax=Cannabis sativa TaxID=3483 RepID=A0A7J6ENH8_CANSA|nr:hypothetical protein F8388_005349 [Cannabis sativa]